MRSQLPASWQTAISAEFDQPYFLQLQEFLRPENGRNIPFIRLKDQVYSALQATPLTASTSCC